MNWLTAEEAIRNAFYYRHRTAPSTLPILLTDFDIKNLRVVEVRPGEWDDVSTWRAAERRMSDGEFSEINSYLQSTGARMAVGAVVMHVEGLPVSVRGYIKRPALRWMPTLDIDEVRRKAHSECPYGRV